MKYDANVSKQITSIRYLLQQGSALRGHIEDDEHLNTLLTLRSDDYTPSNEWQKIKKYQSPVIINKQITILGHCILKAIVQNVSKVKLYSILAIETRDISNREQ